MTGDISSHLTHRPFRPFTICMADGRRIPVPTPDHIAIIGLRVHVTRDDESVDILPGLLMSGLTVHTPSVTDQEESR